MTLQRTAVFASPLGEGPLLFYSMSGREALGRPFLYEVDLLSHDFDIDLSALLGQPASVALERNDGSIREFTGIVTHFALTGRHGKFVRYRAELRPWLWLLGNRVNSRIFQNQTVPAVLKTMFREHGWTDFQPLLNGEYRTWEYLVQYRESDLNFVSRLMEQEGIYYYFKHADGKHTLVLADSYSAHETSPGNEELPYFPPLERERRDVEHVNGWQASRRIRSGKYALVDYNFKRATTLVTGERNTPNNHSHANAELFDFPGGFYEAAEAAEQAKVRLEEHQADYELVEGSATARSLSAGSLFSLTDFPREDQNKEYLITEATHEIRTSEYESGQKDDIEPDYQLRFVAIDAKRPYRAPRITPKPVVEGPQPAVVVGQADQEIWTDMYGRVRVQFFWDREGKYDENSSCFVRVAQIWAGSGFGGIHLPRIGHEVIVDFLEGDPDRPIITGRVYNATNMPPYTLPDSQTQSGIKSRSTLDGTPDNFNELRFEDKKGKEEVYLQAEKDHNVKVKNNQSHNVVKNRSASVGGDDSVSVSGNRSVSVTGNLSVTVSGKGGKAPHSSLSVTGKHNVHASDTIDMDAPTHVKFVCGGSSITIEPGKITISAGGGAAIVLDASVLATSQPGTKLKLDADALAEASTGAKLTLTSEVTAQAQGNAKLLLNANGVIEAPGDITLDAVNVRSKGKSTAVLEVGGSSVDVRAPTTTISAPIVNVNGTGTMVAITSPMVKIN
jgi:type VI secretion system secreted protein VgrG